MESADEITVLGNVIRLQECELLRSFDRFDQADWTLPTIPSRAAIPFALRI